MKPITASPSFTRHTKGVSVPEMYCNYVTSRYQSTLDVPLTRGCMDRFCDMLGGHPMFCALFDLIVSHCPPLDIGIKQFMLQHYQVMRQ